VAVTLAGCVSESDTLSPNDTSPTKNSSSDEFFTYGKNRFIAYGFDSEKTEYDYTATDVVESLYFDFDSAKISAGELKKVESVAKIFKVNESLQILIVGNCDKFGAEKYNYSLGQRRAEAVLSALVTLNIDGSRIRTASLGSNKANMEVGSREEAFRDRRCDVVIRRIQ
jgi:peptidoglycan-associated lipoprotein